MHRYTAVIERADGSTFEQDYDDFYDLVDIVIALGEGYWVVNIY